MLTRPQQAHLQPLVGKAWIAHCQLSGISPNNRPAKDAFYRDQLHSCIGKWSTRDADPEHDYQTLIDRFMLLAGEPQPVIIEGWSDSQVDWFNKESEKAWDVTRANGFVDEGVTYRSWINSILASHDILNNVATDRKASFDAVMAELGTISGDERMISHFAEATEIRVRFQINRYMSDLSWLTSTPVTWEYVRAIWTQSALLPDLNEAPAETLVKVLQMLDTHIRRRCKEAGIAPKCLPTRCDQSRCTSHVSTCQLRYHQSGRPVQDQDEDGGSHSTDDQIPF